MKFTENTNNRRNDSIYTAETILLEFSPFCYRTTLVNLYEIKILYAQ